MNATRLVRQTGLVSVAAASVLAMAATPAVAGTGALSRTGASMTYNNHTKLAYTSFVVKDTKADGVCARAYMYVAGWIYLGQACGNGSSTSGTHAGSPSSVKVCTGMPNATSSNCLKQTAA